MFIRPQGPLLSDGSYCLPSFGGAFLVDVYCERGRIVSGTILEGPHAGEIVLPVQEGPDHLPWATTNDILKTNWDIKSVTRQ